MNELMNIKIAAAPIRTEDHKTGGKWARMILEAAKFNPNSN